MHRFLFLSALCLAFSSCHTIEIVNDRAKSTQLTPSDWTWNHTGIFGLINYSEDFQTSDLCVGKEWSMVTTELNYGPFGAEAVMVIASNFFGPVGTAASIARLAWSPRSVAWQCVAVNE